MLTVRTKTGLDLSIKMVNYNPFLVNNHVSTYKRLPIYKVAQMYREEKCSEVPLHLFAISDNAYNDMMMGEERAMAGLQITELLND